MIRRVVSSLALAALVSAACNRKQPNAETAIAPLGPEAPRRASWLGAIKQPLNVKLESANDDPVARVLLAQLQRYAATQPRVRVEHVPAMALRLSVTYGDRTTSVDGLVGATPTKASYLTARAIRDVIDRENGTTHRIGFLFGEKQKQSGYDALAEHFAKQHPTYRLEKVDVHAGAEWKDIDQTLEGLIVASPHDDMSMKELRRIDKFLMRGGPVAVFGNQLRFHGVDPSMNGSTDGALAALLHGYGVDFKHLLVVDKKQFWNPIYKGIRLDPYPPTIIEPATPAPTFLAEFAAFVDLPRLVVTFATEIVVDEGRAKRNGATVTRLAWTTKDIVTVQGSAMSYHPARDKMGNGATGQTDEKREATIAVAIAGAIGSAFDAPGDGVTDVPKSVASGRGRLLVISSAGFIANPFRDAGASPFALQMPGMDPNLGADEELLKYADMYEPERAFAVRVAKQSCDWLLGVDELVEP
jgi:hypothetical protein